MATSITRPLADTYFETRLENEVWKGFDTGLRDKAIVSATDIITRALGSDITDETVDADTSYYPDRAVYHQALYLLINGDYTSNGELSAPKWPGATSDGQARKKQGRSISRESLYWMNWRQGSTIKIARG